MNGEFGAPGGPASDVTYRVRVTGKGNPADLEALARHTDTVAEIQNTLRGGAAVTLAHVEVAPAAGDGRRALDSLRAEFARWQALLARLADGTYGRLSLDASPEEPGVTVRAERPGRAKLTGASLQGSHLTLSRFEIDGEVTVEPGSTGMDVRHNRISGGYFGVNSGPTSSTPPSGTTPTRS